MLIWKLIPGPGVFAYDNEKQSVHSQLVILQFNTKRQERKLNRRLQMAWDTNKSGNDNSHDQEVSFDVEEVHERVQYLMKNIDRTATSSLPDGNLTNQPQSEEMSSNINPAGL